MSYAEMLCDMIDRSKLSLRQITKRCADFGLSITPSYVSQLKNGKLPPPSPEVSMILAKACESKEQSKLIFQGYLEKAPDVIKEYMFASSNLNKIMLETLYKAQESNVSDSALAYLREMDVLTAIEMSSKYMKDGGAEIENDLAKRITLESGGIVKDNDSEIMTVFLGDNAMAPTIPIHSFLYIIRTRTDLLKDRDIIAFYPGNRKILILRRMYLVKEKILLIPDDRTSEILILDSFDEIDYVGKVASFKVDL
ncbi:MAG: S24/S26 family peptidase [Clostridiales bacterium]|nr:S24/S26 family peptidase [Clostridiales bacterium]